MARAQCAAARRLGVQSGFTLMEVLIAISIFALIGVASYRVLSSVMQADERVAARSEQMRTINRAFWLLQQDAEQLVPRNVRDASGNLLLTDNYLLVQNGADLPLQFTRGGRANPLGLPRSSMLRVAYAVGHHPDYEKSESPHYHEDRLYLLRYTWPMLDGSGDKAKAQVQIVLPDVQNMAIGVLTKGGTQSSWPLVNVSDPPLALQIDFTLADGSHLKRAYKLW
ncbi:MAG TPA: type II secretion system minor pseudopilin GspJ [Spongiibacteraceae bacterium]|nr:type II secretion system minor pseudopilin GspJ [Spongiibacteraceae bacterium]